MRAIDAVRNRLGWKLFLSYLVIVLVGVAVLAGTAELLMPVALAPHVARMRALFGNNPGLDRDLYENFSTAINEVLVVAAAAAALAAAGVSLFVARRIVVPVRAMMEASQSIAAGDYHRRVRLSGTYPDGQANGDELMGLGAAFNRMAEVLEETEQRRMELIGNVAHELRTPLASLRSMTEGLADGVLLPDSDTWSGIEQELERLQRLVSDLEELSRAEAGQIPLDRHPVPPAELIETTARRLEPQFEAKDVALAVELSPDLPPVQADFARAVQILTNLVGNALQYTASGGRVTIRAERRSREVAFVIADTGIGIAPEHLPHVFERFYRIDKSRARVGGGSGIGLTIARHLVEAHGGQIWAESAGPGQGSTFTFTLPVA